MKKIREKIMQNVPANISDFFKLYKELAEDVLQREVEGGKKIKIAFLASFTTKGFVETLTVKCCAAGISPKIYVGDYNQYNQEIFDDGSGLYKFNPDLIFLFIDSRTLLGEHFFIPYKISDDERKVWVEGKLTEIRGLVEKIKSRVSAKIILHNFEVPAHSPLGILENKQNFGLVEAVERLNFKMRDVFKKDSQVFIFDFNAFSSDLGKSNLLDHKMYYLADLKIGLCNIPKLCEAYLSYIKPAVSNVRKCIILDLDNTLWGGIVGEDGMGGIKIGPTPEGRSFWEFQKHLLSLFNRGIILAINSKNNYEDALKVLREHPDMILREENFASIKINWNDKATNIKAIAEELNIGTDSLVFFDDDKLNREIVKSELPEVLVVEVPEDSSLYAKTLMNLNDFNYFQLTEEDREKGRMYSEQRQREEFKNVVTDINEYLKGLAMEIEIEKINDFNLPRLSQLTQKTNQFNLTTRRYTEEDLKIFKKRGDLIFSVRVKDKFGDNGITGMAIVEGGTVWRLDSFLLSCRVIGRKVEETMLDFIFRSARTAGVDFLRAQFIPTPKNSLAKDFLKNSGFDFVGNDGEAEDWQCQTKKELMVPDYIKVIIK